MFRLYIFGEPAVNLAVPTQAAGWLSLAYGVVTFQVVGWFPLCSSAAFNFLRT